jgi:serine/threonine protein kinase
VAWEADFSRWVAVKILQNLDEAAHRRFDRERSLMGRSSDHPNVITPIRSGLTVDAKPYLIMQYREGGSLQDLVDRGEVMGGREAIGVIRPIAEALGASHRNGVLHKDVKPANILLASNGSPSLTDFGISSIRGSTVTQTAFTFAHAPPETFSDGTDVRDERSDLYSLASTLFTIIAGHDPFWLDGSGSQLAWMHRIANSPVPELGVSDQLDRFLAAALAKDPAQRPQTAQEFVEGLDQVLGSGNLFTARGVNATEPEGSDGGSSSTVGEAVPPDRRPSSGRALGWVAVAVALLGLGAAGWFAFVRDPDGDSAAQDGSSSATSSPLAESGPGSGDGETGDTSQDEAQALAPEVQEAISLLQQPDSDIGTAIGSVFLPDASLNDTGFTHLNCETKLGALRTAFGGPDLPQLREEIAQWPSGSPKGYTDPAQLDRGYLERLNAYVDQTEVGYSRCIGETDIRPVGTHVLSGWASIQSFFCVTGTVTAVELADGSPQPCPTPDELDLCIRILQPQLDTFFQAFPDRKPDGGAACQAAMVGDQGELDQL